jgi:hypothetical protein
VKDRQVRCTNDITGGIEVVLAERERRGGYC